VAHVTGRKIGSFDLLLETQVLSYLCDVVENQNLAFLAVEMNLAKLELQVPCVSCLIFIFDLVCNVQGFILKFFKEVIDRQRLKNAR
jgi:hypothetical protein